MARFDYKAIENKWRKQWLEAGLYQPDVNTAKKPFYNLMMFPYPSAEGLHVGNMYAFTGADVFGRYQRMKGNDVFEPIGLDGFGIHSENYAIKVGKHPKEQAQISQKRFYEQLSKIGNGFAWDNRLETYDPEYYKWTQWLFTEMFKHGLAYRKSARVNWCPSCKTVLADEQVEAGVCERCKSETTFKELEQWFFKITEYAEELLQDIDKLEWPEKIKIAQRQWIGKSKGLNIEFEVDGGDEKITVWTKFWETVFGTTYLVLAPEYPLVEKLIEESSTADLPTEKIEEIREYVRAAKEKTETQRKQEEKDKTGVFTGMYAINPVNGEKVPIWVADYVLMDVGTGAVMGVPAHDERDFDFAKKHQLPIVQVVTYDDKDVDGKVAAGEMAFEGEGRLIHSGQFDGMDAWGGGKAKMAEWMIEQGFGQWLTTYHLRDWLISRQRYWGPPIPMVYCEACAKAGKTWFDTQANQSDIDRSTDWSAGWFPVELGELPIKLPDLEEFKPQGDGSAPLDNAPEDWLYTKCPHCGGKAKRETDVSDTFLDSSWYFLAYPNLKTKEWRSGDVPWDEEVTKKWLPVTTYIGGAEHAVLHLLYSRFVWKALQDWGLLSRMPEAPANGREPFPFLYGHGLIIKDGAKMSKSRGNVVNPDEYIEKYGADTLRSYLMFLGPYDQGGDFRDSGIAGMRRFLDRVWHMYTASDGQDLRYIGGVTQNELRSVVHETIAKVNREMSQFKYNTAMAAVMEAMNAWRSVGKMGQEEALLLLKLLAPLAPYMTEELWARFKGQDKLEKPEDSIHYQQFPTSDAEAIADKPALIVVQVNGKMRASMEIDLKEWEGLADAQEEAIERAKAMDQVAKWFEGKHIRKTIWIAPQGNKQGLLNFVV